MDNQFLFRLNEFLSKEIENNEDYQNSIMIMAVEVDKTGRPLGTINKIFAPPFSALGLLDYMSVNLSTLRDGIFDKLEDDQMKVNSGNEIDFSQLLDSYPPELKHVVEKYDDQLKEAILNGDMEALEELKRLILGEMNKLKGDSKDDDDDDDDNFNMEDFTGGSV